MNFLFEIQKKNKNQVLEKKKVSMDVRAPERFDSGTFSYSFNTTPKKMYGKRMDGVKVQENIWDAKQEYARRVSEVAATPQVKKTSLAPSGMALILHNAWEVIQDVVARIPISFPHFTPNKLVYGSIMSGVAFGMVSLGLIEKTFESNAVASEEANVQQVEAIQLETENYNPEKDVFMQYFSDAADAEYQEGVRNLVAGYPIEEMLPYIFEKDRVTAAFLIGIAKKESNWGKRRPVLDGQDCFNYWGYRGQRRLMGSGGHTCFNSRKDAVDTVAKRLETLISSERLNTPAKLIVWKCGMSCEGHGRESVEKWISDVDAYYSEMMALESQNTEIGEGEEEIK